MSAGADASVKDMRLHLTSNQGRHAYTTGSRIGMPVFVTAIYQTSYKSRGLDQPSFITDDRSISIARHSSTPPVCASMSQSNQRQSFSYHGAMMGQDLDSDGEGDGRGGKGRDGEKGDKKGIINRVNRKCSPIFLCES
jgi:hypothetical protein